MDTAVERDVSVVLIGIYIYIYIYIYEGLGPAYSVILDTRGVMIDWSTTCLLGVEGSLRCQWTAERFINVGATSMLDDSDRVHYGASLSLFDFSR